MVMFSHSLGITLRLSLITNKTIVLLNRALTGTDLLRVPMPSKILINSSVNSTNGAPSLISKDLILLANPSLPITLKRASHVSASMVSILKWQTSQLNNHASMF